MHGMRSSFPADSSESVGRGSRPWQVSVDQGRYLTRIRDRFTVRNNASIGPPSNRGHFLEKKPVVACRGDSATFPLIFPVSIEGGVNPVFNQGDTVRVKNTLKNIAIYHEFLVDSPISLRAAL